MPDLSRRHALKLGLSILAAIGPPKPHTLTGYAQPEPRAIQKSGKNGIQMQPFEVT